jgi:hypothetical protein
VLRDTSIYAGQNEEERYAELVTILHAPGGLDRLSKAARGRILRVQSLANEYQAAGHGNPAL